MVELFPAWERPNTVPCLKTQLEVMFETFTLQIIPVPKCFQGADACACGCVRHNHLGPCVMKNARDLISHNPR